MKSFLTAMLIVFFAASSRAENVENSKYVLSLNADGSVSVAPKGKDSVKQVIQPQLTVMFSAVNPLKDINHQNYYLAPRTAVRWAKYNTDIDRMNEYFASAEGLDSVGARGELVEEGGKRRFVYRDKKSGRKIYSVSEKYSAGTTNPFEAGEKTTLRASKAEIKKRSIVWSFPENEIFEAEAVLTLGAGDSNIELSHSVKAKKKGYFSVAFSGLPQVERGKCRWIPQEVFGRNARQFNHLVHEGTLKLPRAQIYTDEFSAALVVDSSCAPFRVPNKTNAKFGLMMALEDSKIRPMAFAPIMGGEGSKMKSGDIANFKIHYFINVGQDWVDALKYTARKFFNFRDMRDNSGAGSINNAVYRSVDFLSNANGKNYAMWHAEQKYYDYWNDSTGVFKPFSLLYGLSAAVVLDDLEFFKTRVYPHTEFSLSRTNNVFCPYDIGQTKMLSRQSRGLGYPYCSAAEILGIASFYGFRSPYVDLLVKQKGFDGGISDSIAQAEVSGNRSLLSAAEKTALSRYDKTRRVEFNRYQDLLDLYDATKNPQILQYARIGAYAQVSLMNLSPEVKDTLVVADEGSEAPVHLHSFGRHTAWGYPLPKGLKTPEKEVPAWRVSLTGLESPAYRGEYWMHHHGQLLRLGYLLNDTFLRDVAYWGMIGRFGMFAGDNRSQYSLVAENPDVVERPVWQWTFATVNPGHAWEFVGEALDFLISDAYAKSEGKIDFPSRVMPKSGFRVRVYGDRAGRFFDSDSARLWMPKNLLEIDNPQMDFVCAYDADTFYIAFMNRSAKDESFTVKFNPEKLECGKYAEILCGKQNGVRVENKSNSFALGVPAKGMSALKIPTSKIKTTLQKLMLDSSVKPLGQKSYVVAQTPFGKLYAYMLCMGKGLTYAHIYTDALPENTIAAKLRYTLANGKTQELSDEIFPYEFTVEIPDDASVLEFEFLHENSKAKISSSGKMKIER